MKITKRQLRRIIKEAMGPDHSRYGNDPLYVTTSDIRGHGQAISKPAQPPLATRLRSLWDKVAADTLDVLGDQATWEEIADEVLAAGYSIDPGLIEEINLLPWKKQQAIFKRVFGAGVTR